MFTVYEKVKRVAEGAALMTGPGYSLELISGMHENIGQSSRGAVTLQNNLNFLGPISYLNEEIEFAKAIQRATNKEQLGLDGNVSPLKETLPRSARWAQPMLGM